MEAPLQAAPTSEQQRRRAAEAAEWAARVLAVAREAVTPVVGLARDAARTGLPVAAKPVLAKLEPLARKLSTTLRRPVRPAPADAPPADAPERLSAPSPWSALAAGSGSVFSAATDLAWIGAVARGVERRIAPKPAARPWLGRAALLLAAAPIAAAAVAAASVASVMVFGGAVPLPQAGWAQNGYRFEPQTGEWLGFKQGGQRNRAAQNACDLLASHRIAEPNGFDCEQDRFSRTLWAFYSNHETWIFRPALALRERHCLGLKPERVVVELTGDRVDRVSATCTLA